MTEPPKIPSNGFIVDSASHDEFQKKSLHKSDPGKGINLHIFKICRLQRITTFLWLVLHPINVLATDRKMGFLNQVNIFLSTYDVL